MKTIIHLDITDEERTLIAATLGLSQMVSRKQVTLLVVEHIAGLMLGPTSNDDNESKIDGKTEPESARKTEDVAADKPARNRDQGVSAFVPSRGDEAYLCRPSSTELAAVCSQILDGLEFIEAFTWETVERNRK